MAYFSFMGISYNAGLTGSPVMCPLIFRNAETYFLPKMRLMGAQTARFGGCDEFKKESREAPRYISIGFAIGHVEPGPNARPIGIDTFV
jgi:hypothetical protein